MNKPKLEYDRHSDISFNNTQNIAKSNRNYKICDFTKDELGYGFRITGNAPVKVFGVRKDGAAWNAGLRENDVIIEINRVTVKEKTHKEVVGLIRTSHRVIIKVKPSQPEPTVNNNSPKKITPPFSSGSVMSLNSTSRTTPATSTTRIPTTSASSSSSQMSNYKANSMIRSPTSPPVSTTTNVRFKSNTSTLVPSTNHHNTSGPPQPSPKLLTELQIHQNKSNNKTNHVSSLPSHTHDVNRPVSLISNKGEAPLPNVSVNNSSVNSAQTPREISSPQVFKKPHVIPPLRPKSVAEPAYTKKPSLKPDEEPIKKNNVTKSSSVFSSNSTSSSSSHKTEESSTDFSTSSENTEVISKIKTDQDDFIETPIKSFSYNASTLSGNNGSRVKSSYGSTDDLQKNSTNNSRNNLHTEGIGSFGDNINNNNNAKSRVSDNVLKKVMFRQSAFETKNRFEGRSFDDEDDFEDDRESAVHETLKDFNKTMGSPVTVANLLEIDITTQDTENYIFLYFAIKNYEMQQERSNFLDSARRMANEIITTFLLEDSPITMLIREDIKENLMQEIRQNWRITENLGTIFDSVKLVTQEYLQEFILNVRERIERGTLFKKWTFAENYETEMKKLYRVFDKFHPKPSKETKTDLIRAQQIAYCTLYSTFLRSQPFTPTSSFRWKSRSTDNLTQSTRIPSIAENYKLTSLSSFSEAKNFASLRKKTKNVNGHNLKLESCEEPQHCAVCNTLLWGPSPQGYRCTSCMTNLHVDCRKKFKNPCSKKLKKYSSQTSLKEEKGTNNSAGFFGRLSRKSSSTSIKSATCLNDETDRTTVGSLKEQDSQNSGGHSLQDERRINSEAHQNSRYFDNFNDEQLNRASSMHLPTKSNDIYLNNNNYPVSTPRYDTKLEQFKLSNSSSNHSPNLNVASVQIKELVPSVDELKDPDMNVDESFDATIELNIYFPNLPETADKKRIIVLLEFYHKTRYILMNLKKLDYKLVKQWPEKYMSYFYQLGLGAVEPLIKLIKSLVKLIDTCVGEKDFVDLETKVFKWISGENDRNLKEWIGLVSNLVCTNNLNSSKTIKQQIRNGGPEFDHINNAKFNKSYVLENLNQMRPLLINLPLITKNITKCLRKSEELYIDQLEVWEEISIKFDWLCEFIDRCCVPLVEHINAGFIRSSRQIEFQFPKASQPFARTPLSASSSGFMPSLDASMELPCGGNDNGDEYREYFQEFPRLAFQHAVCDYQRAKIFEWRTNMKRAPNAAGLGGPTSGNSTVASSGSLQHSSSTSGSGNDSAVQMKYFKRGTDVMLLLYHRFIVVLQKEQEHYSLKLIKPQRGSSDDYRFPILNIDSKDLIVTIGGVEDEFHILNIIENKQEYALLLRIGFRSLEVVENWLELIKHKRHNIKRTISIFKTADSKQTATPPTSLQRTDTSASINSVTVSAPSSFTPEPSNPEKSPPVLSMEQTTEPNNPENNKDDEKLTSEKKDCTAYCLQKLDNFLLGNDDFLKQITDEQLRNKMASVFSCEEVFDMSPVRLQENRALIDFKFVLYKYCLNVVEKTRECFLDESLDANSELCCLIQKQMSFFKSADHRNNEENIIKPQIQSKENTPIEKGSQDSVNTIARELVIDIIDSSVEKIENNTNQTQPITMNQNHIQSKIPPATLPKPFATSNYPAFLNHLPIGSIEPNDSMLNNHGDQRDINGSNGKYVTSRKDIVVSYREPESSKIATPVVTSFYKPPPQPALASSYLHRNSNPTNHKQMSTINEIIPAESRNSITKSSTSSC